MSPTRDDDGFLSRWSRRKLASAEPKEALAPEPDPAIDVAAEAPAPVVDEDDATVLERLQLPDPDTLGPNDDFRQFMSEAVPTRLRNRALRRLWLSNPALANLDELVDYGEDFTDAATVVENLQTLYQVGRGIAPPEPDPEGEPGPDLEPTVDEVPAADAVDGEPASERAANVEPVDDAAPVDAETTDGGDAAAPLVEASTPQIDRGDIETPSVARTYRRNMTFVFEDDAAAIPAKSLRTNG